MNFLTLSFCKSIFSYDLRFHGLFSHKFMIVFHTSAVLLYSNPKTLYYASKTMLNKNSTKIITSLHGFDNKKFSKICEINSINLIEFICVYRIFCGRLTFFDNSPSLSKFAQDGYNKISVPLCVKFLRV